MYAPAGSTLLSPSPQVVTVHHECFVCRGCNKHINAATECYEMVPTCPGSPGYHPYHYTCRHTEQRKIGTVWLPRHQALVVGEPKAENQNNMLPAAWGEVINIMDMNQDAYYGEGLKLPLVYKFFKQVWLCFQTCG